MKYSKTKHVVSQRGAGHVVVAMACLAMVGVFAAGYTVNKQNSEAKKSGSGSSTVAKPAKTSAGDKTSQTAEVRWEYGSPEKGWFVTGGATAPKCPSKILANSPVDTAKATTVLLPGQYRGSHYKAHGGFRYDGSASTDIQVKLPFDGRLVGLTRYIESNELQYLLTFEHPCGYQLRFDHLAVLSDEFTKIAATTPEPKVDDTRGLPLQDQPSFKAGTVVATAIGHAATNNIGLDIGVYDLRQPNKISQNAAWASLHANERPQTFYGTCWLSMLPRSDASRAQSLLRKLPKTDQGASDYCTDAPGGSTLQYNGGQPVQR